MYISEDLVFELIAETDQMQNQEAILAFAHEAFLFTHMGAGKNITGTMAEQAES